LYNFFSHYCNAKRISSCGKEFTVCSRALKKLSLLAPENIRAAPVGRERDARAQEGGKMWGRGVRGGNWGREKETEEERESERERDFH